MASITKLNLEFVDNGWVLDVEYLTDKPDQYIALREVYVDEEECAKRVSALIIASTADMRSDT